jgi:recombination protein RecT
MTEQNTAVAVQQQKSMIVVRREQFEARINEIKAALPPGMSPQRVIRAVMTAMQINPDLQACNFASLWTAVMKCCQAGLLPNGEEAALVPYKDKVTFIPMYKGKLRKFQESGLYRWITADVVREGEDFEYWINESGPHFRHVPGGDGKVIKAYAIATTTTGGVFVAVMSVAELNKVQKVSRASRDDAPWKIWPEEMQKKTALHRLSKMLPTAPLFDGEDEDEDIEETIRPQLAAVNPDRARGAAAALDAFAPAGETGEDTTSRSPEGAGHHPDSGPLDATGETGGRGDTGNDTAATQPISEPQTATADAQAVAFRRGEDAKAKGHQRKALPPEYRTPERDAEAQEWLRGWDSKPEGSPKA